MESSVYISYGECRCCLVKGYHRDITKEYQLYSKREVYIDIFYNCFNLSLSKSPELTTLICSSCVERLHDANRFKQLVIDTEQQLLGIAQKTADGDATVEVKIEPKDTDSEGETEFKYELNPDDIDLPPDDEPTLPLRSEKPPRIRIRQKPETILRNSEKGEYVNNCSTIIINSNVTPFRSKSRTHFPCFYCREDFETFNDLRIHNYKHNKTDSIKVLKTMSAETFVLYIDIQNLMCTLCQENQPNLPALKKHLTDSHSKNFASNYPCRMVPFAVDNSNPYICTECETTFETFGSLERHMNAHFRNYVCTECNSGYITRYRLKVHFKSMHEAGAFPCDHCGKIFTTNLKHKNHVNHVHKMVKRFKCSHCPERFGEYFMRHKHMVQEHGVAPLEYKCTICDKVFEKRYNQVKHMKRDHLDDKSYQCEFCGYKCCVKHDLTLHLVKHTGERSHQCPICKKAFVRKKTLTEHMKIHSGERNHGCDRCGMTFVQRGSLSAHRRNCKK